MFGLLLASAAPAAEATGCSIRKGLYDSWLSLSKRAAHRPAASEALVPPGQLPLDATTVTGIAGEYRIFFQCLSDAPAPADEEAGRSWCKDAAPDRLAFLVCQTALYLKTGRSGSKDLLDALPASKKNAEMVWDLQSITEALPENDRSPAIFLPQGPAYKIVDELFVLVLDDKDMAAAKYFHIVGNSSGPASRHMDAQIKILIREAPAVVVKQWEVLRQHQPRIKKLLAELATELPAADMKKLRQGITAFCAPGNLDCPEILKLFGRPD